MDKINDQDKLKMLLFKSNDQSVENIFIQEN